MRASFLRVLPIGMHALTNGFLCCVARARARVCVCCAVAEADGSEDEEGTEADATDATDPGVSI